MQRSVFTINTINYHSQVWTSYPTHASNPRLHKWMTLMTHWMTLSDDDDRPLSDDDDHPLSDNDDSLTLTNGWRSSVHNPMTIPKKKKDWTARGQYNDIYVSLYVSQGFTGRWMQHFKCGNSIIWEAIPGFWCFCVWCILLDHAFCLSTQAFFECNQGALLRVICLTSYHQVCTNSENILLSCFRQTGILFQVSFTTPVKTNRVTTLRSIAIWYSLETIVTSKYKKRIYVFNFIHCMVNYIY